MLRKMESNELRVRGWFAVKVLRREALRLEREFQRRKDEGLVDYISSQMNTVAKFREQADLFASQDPNSIVLVWEKLLNINELELIKQGYEPTE